jgi:hypothetical protein
MRACSRSASSSWSVPGVVEFAEHPPAGLPYRPMDRVACLAQLAVGVGRGGEGEVNLRLGSPFAVQGKQLGGDGLHGGGQGCDPLRHPLDDQLQCEDEELGLSGECRSDPANRPASAATATAP